MESALMISPSKAFARRMEREVFPAAVGPVKMMSGGLSMICSLHIFKRRRIKRQDSPLRETLPSYPMYRALSDYELIIHIRFMQALFISPRADLSETVAPVGSFKELQELEAEADDHTEDRSHCRLEDLERQF